MPFESCVRSSMPRGIGWYSLQKDVDVGAPLVELDARNDLDDNAALIAELDLVISVDTGIAHLAAALGRPTWILLPYAPDWRWQLDRTDSPWYPTARLFRQPTAGRLEKRARCGRARCESALRRTAPVTPRRPHGPHRSAPCSAATRIAPLTACRQALAATPDDARAWTLLGVALRRRDPRAALQALHRAVGARSPPCRCAFHLGQPAARAGPLARCHRGIPAGALGRSGPSGPAQQPRARPGRQWRARCQPSAASALCSIGHPPMAQALRNLAHLLCRPAALWGGPGFRPTRAG